VYQCKNNHELTVVWWLYAAVTGISSPRYQWKNSQIVSLLTKNNSQIPHLEKKLLYWQSKTMTNDNDLGEGGCMCNNKLRRKGTRRKEEG